jgi:hypothetical protein
MTKKSPKSKTPKGKKSGSKSGSKSKPVKASSTSDSDGAAAVSQQPSRAASPSGASTNNDFDAGFPVLSPSHPLSRDEVPSRARSPSGEEPTQLLLSSEFVASPQRVDEAQTLSDDDVQCLGDTEQHFKKLVNPSSIFT